MKIDDNKLLMAWPNHVDQANLVGGNFRPTLPLNNAKNRVFAKKARTVGLESSGSTFDILLDGSKKIDVLGIAAHNLSTSATIRWKMYLDSGKTDLIYDSGITSVWPVVFAEGELEWEENNFWEATVTQEDIQSYTPLVYHIVREEELKYPAVITVEISDESNFSGYIEFGRVFAGSGYQPSLNMAYGATLGFENSTSLETSLGQTEYFDVKIPRRIAEFTLDAVTVDEGHGTLLRMQRQQGIDKEIFFTYLADQTSLQYNRTFIGRLKQPDAISQPYVDRLQNRIQLLEIV